MKRKKPQTELITAGEEVEVSRKLKDGTARHLYTKFTHGEWQARRYAKGRVELRYGAAVVMRGRGKIAYLNAKDLVDHLHSRNHKPDLSGGSCLADYPRPSWMAPPPKVKPPVFLEETPVPVPTP